MRIASSLLATVAFGTTLALAGSAHAAGLDSCGDFFFDAANADVSCTVEVEGGCTANCQPIAFEVECAAQLQVGCQGMCNVDADVECTGACQGSCEAECAGGNFDCNAYCEGNCQADCSTTCSGSANQSQCISSCEANCQVECGANCQANPPDCMTACQGCCTGECRSQINAQCQIDCQASGYVDCEASLQGGCEAQCSKPEGALFCDGQWVDTDTFDQCIADIEAAFNVEVSGYASGECSGNECTAEAGGSVSCSAAPTSPSFSLGVMVFGMIGAGAAAARRLTRKK